MALQYNNEEQANKLDKAIGSKNSMKKSMNIVARGTSKSGNCPYIGKTLARIAVHNPQLYSLILSNLKKAEERVRRQKDEEQKERFRQTEQEVTPEEKMPRDPQADAKQPQGDEKPVNSESDKPEQAMNNPSQTELAEQESQVDEQDPENPVVDEQAAQEQVNQHVSQPDPTYAQPNNQEAQYNAERLETEIRGLEMALEQIRQLAHEQGLITDQELTEIIIPLQAELHALQVLVQPGEEYRQQPKPQVGPRRMVATAERDLENSASIYNEKSDKSTDINKARGWHGDSTGHAEAARERWEQEGVAPGGKPESVKPKITERIGREVSRTAQTAARKAARAVANTMAETAADVALSAIGTLAGIAAWRYLNHKPISPMAMAVLAKTATKRKIKQLLNTKRMKQLRTEENLRRLRSRAAKVGVITAAVGTTAAASRGVREAIESEQRRKDKETARRAAGSVKQ